MLTIECLRYLLDYDPETGILRWKTNRPHRPAGSIAGAVDKQNGRRLVSIGGKTYKAHILAWSLYYGTFPDQKIDHADRNPDNNAIRNLRLASSQQNAANSRKQTRNTTGFKGVGFETERGMFKAVIGFNGRNRFLGRFATAEAAHDEYERAAKYFFGEFARGA